MSGVFLKGMNEVAADFASEAANATVRARVVVQKYSRATRETMRSFAPVGERDDDGVHMRDTITYTTTIRPGGVEGEIGPTARRDGFPYPAAVEWGTSKMAPQAFAGPALDRHSADFVAAIARQAVGL